MQISRVRASNWRNFKNLDFELGSRLFIVGPNASGKSNLLDLFRFVSVLSAPRGRPTAAVERRGGLSKVRSLFARNNQGGTLIFDPQVRDDEVTWCCRFTVERDPGGAVMRSRLERVRTFKLERRGREAARRQLCAGRAQALLRWREGP